MRRKKDRSNGITALYERLSRDDDNAGESNSIVHQKQMLEDYAIKHGFTNLVHFTDDGWSGATFDRPSWNRLVEGVKNGEITACICKDMSRIGRDHLQVGFFTDILFREKEVRFIAINNGIDSDRQETSEFAPFLNIMNEWFVRDTSKKIKAVLKSRGSSGNAHTSNIPPYGYLKDPENPDHWIIDEEAAEVVRRIYRMTIEGKGPYQIARELSEENLVNSYGVGLGNDEGDTVLRCASVDALGIPYIRIAPTCIYSCDYLCRVLNFCHIIGPPLFVLWYKSTESFRALHFHDSYVNSQSTLSGYLLISVVVSNA